MRSIADAMTLSTYNAGVAGLSWGLAAADDSVVLTVGGYSQKLRLLLKQVKSPPSHSLPRPGPSSSDFFDSGALFLLVDGQFDFRSRTLLSAACEPTNRACGRTRIDLRR